MCAVYACVSFYDMPLCMCVCLCVYAHVGACVYVYGMCESVCMVCVVCVCLWYISVCVYVSVCISVVCACGRACMYMYGVCMWYISVCVCYTYMCRSTYLYMFNLRDLPLTHPILFFGTASSLNQELAISPGLAGWWLPEATCVSPALGLWRHATTPASYVGAGVDSVPHACTASPLHMTHRAIFPVPNVVFYPDL